MTVSLVSQQEFQFETTNKLVEYVRDWAHQRNLILGSDPQTQFHKLIQECGEFSDDLCKGKDTRSEFGDILVVLIILAEQLEYSLEEALTIAYEKIKHRKGLMINGVFVKEDDLAAEDYQAN